MQESVSRRELFNKFLSRRESAQKFIPPPYFCGEFDCVGCEAPCVSACKRELLSFEDGIINFKFKTLGCNFCKDCAIACESIEKEVLSLKFPAVINAKISIDVHSCLAWNGTICYNCQDICRYRAIDFLGVFRPMINDKCVGCVQCMEVCFVNSIKMESK